MLDNISRSFHDFLMVLVSGNSYPGQIAVS